MHLREWGNANAPLLVMVHGWMDTSFTFQFLVDALAGEWRVVAPDLRGFGRSEWSHENTSGYWFHDYLADLDALLDEIAPQVSVNLMGHSLGGNLTTIYAGVRPERVRRLISLDGFGVPRGSPAQAPTKIAKWLDAIKAGETLRPYASLAAVAARLQKNDVYLTANRAAILAAEWADALPDGQFQLRADPAHKFPFPTVYRLDESIAIWRNIVAPVLWVGASDSQIAQWLGYGKDDPAEMGAESTHSPEFSERLAAFQSIRFNVISQASHNLHHDQPERVARLVEDFFA